MKVFRKLLSILYVCLTFCLIVLGFFRFDEYYSWFHRAFDNIGNAQHALSALILVLVSIPISLSNVFLSDNYKTSKAINVYILFAFSVSELCLVIEHLLSFGGTTTVGWTILILFGIQTLCASILVVLLIIDVICQTKYQNKKVLDFNKLKELYELKEKGIISEEEFDLIKQKYIDQI